MKLIKRISILILILLGVTYYLIANPILPTKKAKTTFDVQPDSLRAYVERLCSTKEFRNYRNVESLNEAAGYIKSKFAMYSDRVEEQLYQVKGEDFRNIICSFGPEDGERIIVGAHYDVCYEQAGADDNASGVAGLIEIARVFSEMETKSNNDSPSTAIAEGLASLGDLGYRVDLVAYTLEEPPHFRSFEMGSAKHAAYCQKNGIEIKAMICLETIGYFSEEKKSQEYPVGAMKLVYPSKGNYIAVVGKMGEGSLARKMKRYMRKGSDINVESVNAPPAVPGIDFSDHLNYWKRGYPAVMVTNTAFYRNANYHQVTDVPETLNYEKMAEVVQGVAYAVTEF